MVSVRERIDLAINGARGLGCCICPHEGQGVRHLIASSSDGWDAHPIVAAGGGSGRLRSRSDRCAGELPTVCQLGSAHGPRVARSREFGERRPERSVRPESREQTLRYWEPWQFDAREAARVALLGISSYVPRDNLASIEDRVRGRRPNRTDVLDGLRELDTVLLRYPERFTRATGFVRVIWLCDIVKDGAPVRGFALPAARAIVVDPTAFDANMFHHEMFHMVDYRLHGSPGDQPAWDALNPRGAQYIGHAAYANELRRGGGLGHAHPHFISDYARAAPAEDRAETFRIGMSDAPLAAERRASSTVIDAKMRPTSLPRSTRCVKARAWPWGYADESWRASSDFTASRGCCMRALDKKRSRSQACCACGRRRQFCAGDVSGPGCSVLLGNSYSPCNVALWPAWERLLTEATSRDGLRTRMPWSA